MTPILREPPLFTGTHLYKYGSVVRTDDEDRLAWLKTILLDHKLYASNATELNDPREAHPILKPISIEDFVAFRRELDPPENELREQAIQLAASIRKPTWDPKGITKGVMDGLHQTIKTFRLYSMTKRWDSLSMWAKYADSHRGYCLEFKNEGWFALAREVIYGDAPLLDITDKQHVSWYWFYLKRADWSNEEEVRIMLPTYYVDHPFFPLNPHLLSRIILGKDMDPAVATRIRAWAVERDPTLPVVSAVFDPYTASLKTV